MSHHQQEEGEAPQAASAKQEEQMKINFLKEGPPLGIGFVPNEAELVHLLKLKIASKDDSVFDFYGYDAQNLSSANSDEMNFHCHDDGKIYMFGPPNSKAQSRIRINRDTPNGRWEWKATREIRNDDGEKVAIKTYAIFNSDELNGDRVSKGVRPTPWQMREFRLTGISRTAEEIVLCVVHKVIRDEAGGYGL